VIRVLVVDDHGVVRLGVELALSGLRGVEVVGTVADGDQALAAVKELSPDVILMDLQMPGRDGIETTREIIRQRPDARVVVLTSYLDRAKIEAALGELRTALAGSDVEAIQAKHEALIQASQEFAQRLYAAAQSSAGAGGARGPGPGAGAASAPSDDEVADAEIVDEGEERSA